jgi:transcriptional regulator with XRE-family HTH domain
MSSVRQRTGRPPADTPQELAAATGLQTVSEYAARVRGLLRDRQLSGELYELAAELREATRALEIRAGVLPLSSPYRDVLADAWLELEAVDRELEAVPEAATHIALESELVRTYAVAARSSIAQTLREARGTRSIRSTARIAGVSASYLKELESGKSIPSVDKAQKIGTAIGVDIASLVADITTRAQGLRERADKREVSGRGRVRLPHDISPRQRERLEVVAVQLLRDEELLEAIETVVALSRDGQRALKQVASVLLAATTSQPASEDRD